MYLLTEMHVAPVVAYIIILYMVESNSSDR